MFNCGLEEKGGSRREREKGGGRGTTRKARRRSLLLGEKAERRGSDRDRARARRRHRPWRGERREEDTDTDSRQRRSDAVVVVAPDAATMRPHCWVMVALAGIMSYLSPERALGAPQREGERRGWGVMEEEEEGGC